MSNISATIEISAETSRVFHYLKTRYDGLPYRLACVEIQERIPRIACLESVENQLLRFSVPGREPLLHLNIGAWQWSYQLIELADSKTKITIDYQWHWFTDFLGLGSIKHQAANALIDDVLALQALCLPLDVRSENSTYSSTHNRVKRIRSEI